MFLYLHSLELLAALWAVIILFKPDIFWVALAIGMTQHMILDIFSNPIYVYGYLLSYRIMRGFRKEYILKRAVLEKKA